MRLPSIGGCVLLGVLVVRVVIHSLEPSGHAHVQFSVMVVSFQKSAGAASDAMLSVMTSFFTPAARAASCMRVVPVTAV